MATKMFTAVALAALVGLATAFDGSSKGALKLGTKSNAAAASTVMRRSLVDASWNDVTDNDAVVEDLFDGEGITCPVVVSIDASWCAYGFFRLVCAKSCSAYADTYGVPATTCGDHDEELAEFLPLIGAPPGFLSSCAALPEMIPGGCEDYTFGLICAGTCEVDCRYWPEEEDVGVFIPECGKSVEVPESAMKKFRDPSYVPSTGMAKDCNY
mmetsp:Transcript_24672/g.77906  ORF Transcript_24672/g.77906 Transcript_24672/m.77906 type:complete len:212 (+) Transcript_24672:258-893(+)